MARVLAPHGKMEFGHGVCLSAAAQCTCAQHFAWQPGYCFNHRVEFYYIYIESVHVIIHAEWLVSLRARRRRADGGKWGSTVVAPALQEWFAAAENPVSRTLLQTILSPWVPGVESLLEPLVEDAEDFQLYMSDQVLLHPAT